MQQVPINQLSSSLLKLSQLNSNQRKPSQLSHNQDKNNLQTNNLIATLEETQTWMTEVTHRITADQGQEMEQEDNEQPKQKNVNN